MEKKCKVVLLPTSKSNIMKELNENRLIYIHYEVEGKGNIESQHLYILSDDEIKEGDWVIRIDRNELWKVNRINTSIDTSHLPKRVFKVIATTNLHLIEQGIASIDDKFIKEYCSNPVEEVNVEYFNSKSLIEEGVYRKAIYTEILKLSSNGSIIIKLVEETWEDVVYKYRMYLVKEGIRKETMESFKAGFAEYVKDNYEVPEPKKK